MPIPALHYRFVPLTAALLLAACSASADSHAASSRLTLSSSASLAALTLPASGDLDDPAADQELDDIDDADDLDNPDDVDPVEHLRRQMAPQLTRRGSGGPVQACTLSSKVTLMGVTEDIRDCMQSNGSLSVPEFQQACEGLANGLNQTGNAPAKIAYSNRCPTPAQGSCSNFMNSGMDAYYYQRTELASLPRACADAGGNWQPGR